MVKATEDLERLWKRYKESGDGHLRNRLILQYLPLVKYISDRIFARLPKRVDIRDLQSAGIFGLISAIEAFDLTRGIKFETYCSVRVRGSILDELRAQDWVPRPVRNRTQKLRECVDVLKRELGRTPNDQELAKRLGIKTEEVWHLGRETMATNFVSLSGSEQDDSDGAVSRMEMLEERSETDPIEILQRADVAELIRRNLDEKEKQVLLLYYYENLTMREIGQFLGSRSGFPVSVRPRYRRRHGVLPLRRPGRGALVRGSLLRADRTGGRDSRLRLQPEHHRAAPRRPA
ncbi:MAG: FliA/WhiG family RNA polymerase sigma factor [Planctomycetota bacterium]